MKLSVKKKRVAISEIMGTLIMVAITLVAGAAVFGWVNGQAGTSETAYGASSAAGANYLREHFAPVTTTFNSCSGSPTRVCTGASFWVFNNGQLAFTLSSLQIQNATSGSQQLHILYNSTGFTAYNRAGVKLACTPSTPGFTGPSSPVPIGTITSAPYAVTIPSCLGVNPISVGQSYIITMTGLYGNVVQFQLTANG